MDVKRIVLLVGALFIAGISAIMARGMLTSSAAPQVQAAPVATGPEILVATKALPVGTIIDAEAIRYQRWPEDLVQPAYYIKDSKGGVDPASLLGTVVRNEITAGQPLTQGALIKPGERGFLAAALGPGMRAVTVAVSNTSGVAGFVFPGDRVDMVLTQQVKGGGDGEPLKVSETILKNVRILAADQRTAGTDGAGHPVIAATATVTLEATPRIAEKIAVAQTMGTLSLSLRSIADNTSELERAIAAGEVKVPQTDDPNAEKRMLLAIASKPIDGATSYSTGADVSRFARSSVPGRDRSSSNQGSTSNTSDSPGPTPIAPTGPMVRIARGNTITVVPVGAY